MKLKNSLERFFGAGNVFGPTSPGVWDISTGKWIAKEPQKRLKQGIDTRLSVEGGPRRYGFVR